MPTRKKSTEKSVKTPAAAHSGPNASLSTSRTTPKATLPAEMMTPTHVRSLRGKGSHAGQQIELQVDQPHEAVLGGARQSLGMGDFDLGCPFGEGIGQNWNEGASFPALQHGFDDVSPIGPKHAAVVVHHDASRRLDEVVDHPGRYFPERTVLSIHANGPDDITAVVDLIEQIRDLLGRILQVGVKCHDDIAGGVRETADDRVVLPVVPVQEDGLDVVRIGSSRSHQSLGRPVATSVIDENQLPGSVQTTADLLAACDQLVEIIDFVIDRN